MKKLGTSCTGCFVTKKKLPCATNNEMLETPTLEQIVMDVDSENLPRGFSHRFSRHKETPTRRRNVTYVHTHLPYIKRVAMVIKWASRRRRKAVDRFDRPFASKSSPNSGMVYQRQLSETEFLNGGSNITTLHRTSNELKEKIPQ